MTEQNKHNAELIAAHTERLRVLELQAATLGVDAPPHILNEIAKIIATIRAIDTLETLTPDQPSTPSGIIERRRDANTNEQATLRMIATVQATVQEVGNVKSDVRLQIGDIRSDVNDIRSDVRKQIREVRTDLTAQTKSIRDDVTRQLADVHKQVADVKDVVSADVLAVQHTIERFIHNILMAIGVAIIFVGVVAVITYILVNR